MNSRANTTYYLPVSPATDKWALCCIGGETVLLIERRVLAISKVAIHATDSRSASCPKTAVTSSEKLKRYLMRHRSSHYCSIVASPVYCSSIKLRRQLIPALCNSCITSILRGIGLKATKAVAQQMSKTGDDICASDLH